jgi:hypothetical protein
LKEWRNRLFTSNFDQFDNNHKYFFDKLNNTPALYSYLSTSAFTPEEGFFDLLDWTYGPPEFSFKNEEHAAVIRFNQVHNLVNKPDTSISGWLMDLIGGSNYQEAIKTYVEIYIDPIVNFLNDQLVEGSSILYLLERYKLRTEWFYKKQLLEIYNSNSAVGENKLEEDLRLFLFDQGIDYPFSTPLSSSGRADVVSMLHTDDPLVLEIKIYDESKGYRKNRIVDGFSQIVKYANDYHKNVGYLIVFNADPVNIEIQGAENDKTWPNRIPFEGKSYYMIFINLNREVSASKAGIIKKITLSLSDLTTIVNT